MVDESTGDLFGRHVRQLALDRALASVRQAPLGLGDAEVRQPRHTVCADHDIVWRDIPMHEIERLAALTAQLVRGGQTGECVGDHRQRKSRRQGFAGILGGRHDPTQRVAFEVVHHQKVAAVRRITDVERGDDIRVVDACGEACLVEEHVDEFFLVREVGVQDLDRDETLEASHALCASDEDFRHAAGRERRQDLVTAESLADQRLGPALGIATAAVI